MLPEMPNKARTSKLLDNYVNAIQIIYVMLLEMLNKARISTQLDNNVNVLQIAHVMLLEMLNMHGHLHNWTIMLKSFRLHK
jgi:hypothetical protein